MKWFCFIAWACALLACILDFALIFRHEHISFLKTGFDVILFTVWSGFLLAVTEPP